MTDTEVGFFVSDGDDRDYNDNFIDGEEENEYHDDDPFGPPEELSSKRPLNQNLSSDNDDNNEPAKKKKKRRRPAPNGNYNRYYGYRTEDHRLDYIPLERVAGKKCLDIGCNTGLLTLKIAYRFRPQSILGIDVDPSLIKTASQSLEDCYDWQMFNAVAFRTEDFASPTLASPEVFERRGKFDVIFCMSVTKWVQLTAGDEGLMRMFRRVYDMLCDGGMFVLEPQPWKSYRKYSKISQEHKENFKKVKIHPNDFEKVLLEEVKFSRVEVLYKPGTNPKNGFDRPIYAYFK